MNKQPRSKRIMAWIIIGMLAILYIATFILAITGSPATKDLFMACFICTIVFPVLLYILNWLSQLVAGKNQDQSDDASK